MRRSQCSTGPDRRTISDPFQSSNGSLPPRHDVLYAESMWSNSKLPHEPNPDESKHHLTWVRACARAGRVAASRLLTVQRAPFGHTRIGKLKGARRSPMEGRSLRSGSLFVLDVLPEASIRVGAALSMRWVCQDGKAPGPAPASPSGNGGFGFRIDRHRRDAKDGHGGARRTSKGLSAAALTGRRHGGTAAVRGVELGMRECAAVFPTARGRGVRLDTSWPIRAGRLG